MQPYNYTIQTQNPFESAVSGLKLGMGLQDMQAQRQAQALKLQQEQQAMLRQQELQSRMQALMTNPNPTVKDYTNLAMLLPQKEADSMRANWDALSKDRQTKDLQSAGQVMAAFQSGAPEIGLQILRERADAAKNSGDTEQAKALETWAKMAEINPGAVTKSIGLMVAQLPGGEKVIESLGKIGTETRAQELHPTAVRKAGAEATTAEVGAKFAESKAISDLEQAGWNIKKMQADMDIAKQNARIAAMNAATAREGNSLKKQELQLKVSEAIQKRDDGIRGKVSEVENARFNIDNLLNTADRIIGTPRGVVESATGPISSRMPTLSQDTADFESLIENLDAQAFLSQIPQMKGTGALSENEGKKLAAALQSLSLKQSPGQLVGNVKEMQRLMLKARKNLADKFGMPENVPDTPAAAQSTSAADIDALVKKYGGK